MNTFVTHPSVRIKGTEHNYNPMRCFDPRCPDHSIHMHCPFCVKRDFYHDPVILKAHFRVKHVDKGIDFAGLKILRCCDHCDIVGIIKGEKKFKGAHWHCYKCRNGFNRRDEAIKHYKTHFRNPQTTFQIQIAQEIHNTSSYDGTPVQSGLSIHPVLTQAVMSTSLAESHSLLNQHATKVNLSNGKSADGTLQVSVAANETVDTSDPSTPTHHIMIIQDEQGDNCERGFTTQIISSEDVGIAEEKEQAVHQNSDNQFEELLQKYQKLQEEKNQMESQLKAVIESLQCQIKVLKDKVKEGEDREKELVEQISVPLDKNIENLMQQLENQHRDLLHQQLLCIKRQYNVQSASSHGNVEICASSVDCPPQGNFVENKPDILPEVQHQENLTEVQDQRDLAEIQHQENLNEIQCHESLVEVQGDGDLTQKAHNPQYSGGTQIFTVVKNFDDSNDQIDQDNDHLESSGLDMEENEDTMKITSSAVDSGEKVVCINYSSLPIDNAGNFQVTHLELQKDDNCQGEVNSCPADDVEVPSPKRQKIV